MSLQPECTTLLHTSIVVINHLFQTLLTYTVQEHVEAGLGGRPEVGVRGLLQLADEEPQAHLTIETQEAARLAFNPAQEFRESMLIFRSKLLCTSSSQVFPRGVWDVVECRSKKILLGE